MAHIKSLVDGRFDTIRSFLIEADRSVSYLYLNSNIAGLPRAHLFRLMASPLEGEESLMFKEENSTLYRSILMHKHPLFAASIENFIDNGPVIVNCKNILKICTNLVNHFDKLRLFGTKWVKTTDPEHGDERLASLVGKSKGFFWTECPPSLKMVLRYQKDLINECNAHGWDIIKAIDAMKINPADFFSEGTIDPDWLKETILIYIVRMAGFVVKEGMESVNAILRIVYRRMLSFIPAGIASLNADAPPPPKIPTVQNLVESLRSIFQHANHHFISYADFIKKNNLARVNPLDYEYPPTPLSKSTTPSEDGPVYIPPEEHPLNLAGGASGEDTLSAIYQSYQQKKNKPSSSSSSSSSSSTATTTTTKTDDQPSNPKPKFSSVEKKYFEDQVRINFRWLVSDLVESISPPKTPGVVLGSIENNIAAQIMLFLKSNRYKLLCSQFGVVASENGSGKIQPGDIALKGEIDAIALDAHGSLTAVSACTNLNSDLEPTSGNVFKLMINSELFQNMLSDFARTHAWEESAIPVLRKYVMIITSVKEEKILAYTFWFDKDMVEFARTTMDSIGNTPVLPPADPSILSSNPRDNKPASPIAAALPSNKKSPKQSGSSSSSSLTLLSPDQMKGLARLLLEKGKNNNVENILFETSNFARGVGRESLTLETFYAFQYSLFAGNRVKDSMIGEILMNYAMFALHPSNVPLDPSQSDAKAKIQVFRYLAKRFYVFSQDIRKKGMHDVRVPPEFGSDNKGIVYFLQTLRRSVGPIVAKERDLHRWVLDMGDCIVKYQKGPFVCIETYQDSRVPINLDGVSEVLMEYVSDSSTAAELQKQSLPGVDANLAPTSGRGFGGGGGGGHHFHGGIGLGGGLGLGLGLGGLALAEDAALVAASRSPVIYTQQIPVPVGVPVPVATMQPTQVPMVTRPLY